MNAIEIKKANNALLNKPGFDSIAAISWKVILYKSNYLKGSIVISDCYKVIELELYGNDELEDPDYYYNSIYKLNTLIQNLQNCKKEFMRMEKIRKDHIRKANKVKKISKKTIV